MDHFKLPSFSFRRRKQNRLDLESLFLLPGQRRTQESVSAYKNTPSAVPENPNILRTPESVLPPPESSHYPESAAIASSGISSRVSAEKNLPVSGHSRQEDHSTAIPQKNISVSENSISENIFQAENSEHKVFSPAADAGKNHVSSTAAADDRPEKQIAKNTPAEIAGNTAAPMDISFSAPGQKQFFQKENSPSFEKTEKNMAGDIFSLHSPDSGFSSQPLLPQPETLADDGMKYENAVAPASLPSEQKNASSAVRGGLKNTVSAFLHNIFSRQKTAPAAGNRIKTVVPGNIAEIKSTAENGYSLPDAVSEHVPSVSAERTGSAVPADIYSPALSAGGVYSLPDAVSEHVPSVSAERTGSAVPADIYSPALSAGGAYSLPDAVSEHVPSVSTERTGSAVSADILESALSAGGAYSLPDAVSEHVPSVSAERTGSSSAVTAVPSGRNAADKRKRSSIFSAPLRRISAYLPRKTSSFSLFVPDQQMTQKTFSAPDTAGANDRHVLPENAASASLLSASYMPEHTVRAETENQPLDSFVSADHAYSGIAQKNGRISAGAAGAVSNRTFPIDAEKIFSPPGRNPAEKNAFAAYSGSESSRSGGTLPQSLPLSAEKNDTRELFHSYLTEEKHTQFSVNDLSLLNSGVNTLAGYAKYQLRYLKKNCELLKHQNQSQTFN